jgi:cell filamentation protein
MLDKYGNGDDLIYCYPNSTVLKNILDITDQNILDGAEVDFTQYRLALYEYPAINKFSLATWKNIHFYLFQDIYSWAGELRTVKISKGSTNFTMPAQIDFWGKSLFKKLEEEKFLCGLCREEFIKRLAYYFGELNILHPFREGNGRSQRLLFELIALNSGYALSWQNVNLEEWIRANIAAVNVDYHPLEVIFSTVVKEIGLLR